MEDRIKMDQRLRRFRTDLNKPSELAIREAIKKVEELEANLKLTEVVVMLNNAFTKLADYFDSTVTEEESIINAVDKEIEANMHLTFKDRMLLVTPKVKRVLLEEIKKQFDKIPKDYIGYDTNSKVSVILYKGFRVVSSEDLADDEVLSLVDIEKLVKTNNEIEEMKKLAYNGLPDNCINGWDEVKFCGIRQGDGGYCKLCSKYKEI